MLKIISPDHGHVQVTEDIRAAAMALPKGYTVYREVDKARAVLEGPVAPEEVTENEVYWAITPLAGG
jgi:hypothetical protein